MSIETREITVRGLPVTVVRKAIKNLHLGVYPPDGRVRVATPMAVSDDAVRLAVIDKFGWIRRRQEAFNAQARQSEREMVSGESHYFLGRRYRLRVIIRPGPARVERRRSNIELYAPPGTDAAQCERILQRWYRQQLRDLALPLVERWQAALGVHVAAWGIRKMKTRWGTCNTASRRIWLNLELAKKPPHCIDDIVVHELAHLIERHHNERFLAIMEWHLPQWRTLRQELNAAPLAHETWSY